MKTPRFISSALVALLSLAAIPSHATITPEAKAVVDRYLDASGGRAAWERTRNMRLTASISVFGLKGRIETWRKAPDMRASEVAIGPFQLKDWGTGDKAWRTDPSGKLLALDGKDLEQAITSGWFDNERWLDADQGGGSIVLASEAKDSLGVRTVLEVAPPSGKSRRLEFDKKTSMLVRTVAKNDQMTITTTNSDFRKVEGWVLNYKSVQEAVGAAANTAIVEVDSVWIGVNIPDERFTPPAGEASSVTWLKTPGTAHIPFQYLSRHVWVRASVNGGPPADFIYDTGASVSIIDSAYAAKIGLKTTGQMQAQGAGSSGGASFATVDKLRLET